MNIFILDKDPRVAARYHCDKHVIKMSLESMQVMGSVYWFQKGITTKKQIVSLGEEAKDLWPKFPRLTESGVVSPYGIGFMNHPSTKWARDSQENFEWLVALTLELTEEYSKRWGKPSNSRKIAEWFQKNTPSLPSLGLTPFYQAVPLEIKDEDAVHAYRLYYAGWKEYFAKWKTQEPDWWRDYLKITVEKGLMQDRVRDRLQSGEHALKKLSVPDI